MKHIHAPDIKRRERYARCIIAVCAISVLARDFVNTPKPFSQATSCAHAGLRRGRLDEIIGNPRHRFGYNPWHHPDVPQGGGNGQGVYGGVSAGCHADGTLQSKALGKNGGERFIQAKVCFETNEKNACSRGLQQHPHGGNSENGHGAYGRYGSRATLISAVAVHATSVQETADRRVALYLLAHRERKAGRGFACIFRSTRS